MKKKRSYATLERENRRLKAEVRKWEALSETIAQLTLRCGPIVFDRLERTAWIGAERIQMEPKPAALLEQLLLHAGEILGADELRAKLWPAEKPGAGTEVPVMVHKLRKALGAAGELVEVVRGQGYRIREAA